MLCGQRRFWKELVFIVPSTVAYTVSLVKPQAWQIIHSRYRCSAYGHIFRSNYFGAHTNVIYALHLPSTRKPVYRLLNFALKREIYKQKNKKKIYFSMGHKRNLVCIIWLDNLLVVLRSNGSMCYGVRVFTFSDVESVDKEMNDRQYFLIRREEKSKEIEISRLPHCALHLIRVLVEI